MQLHTAAYVDRLCLIKENQAQCLTPQNHLTAAKLFAIIYIQTIRRYKNDGIRFRKKLKEMYETPGENKTTMIHLFGIIYSDEIANAKIPAADIIKAADMQPSYATEIYKGVRLGEYVELKNFYKNKF